MSIFGNGQEADPFPGERATEQRKQPMTADSIEAAFEEWRHTLTIKDNPSKEQIFGQGYVAGWNAKEAALKARVEELEGALRSLLDMPAACTGDAEVIENHTRRLHARAALSSADRG